MKKKSTYGSRMFCAFALCTFTISTVVTVLYALERMLRDNITGQICLPSDQSDLESKESRNTIYAIDT